MLVLVFVLDSTSYLLLLVEICEDRKASFASELGTPHNYGFTGRDGNIQVSGICLTNLQDQTTCFEHRIQTTMSDLGKAPI